MGGAYPLPAAEGSNSIVEGVAESIMCQGGITEFYRGLLVCTPPFMDEKVRDSSQNLLIIKRLCQEAFQDLSTPVPHSHFSLSGILLAPFFLFLSLSSVILARILSP